MGKIVLLIVGSFLILSLSSCKNLTDMTTGATKKKSVKLPNKRKSDAYQVIGIVPGIKKFVVQYDDQIIRGGEPYSEEGFKNLKKMNVKTIVSITPTEEERELAKKYNMTFIELPFGKDKGLTKEDKRKFLNLFFQYDAPFYIYCHGGTHRDGILGALYRLELCDWPYGKTMMEYQQLGGDLKQDKIMIDSIKKK